MIPEANLGGDLQTKVSDGGLAASIAMVGSPYRTAVEHGAHPTEVAVKDRVERTASAVIATEHAMIYGLVSLRALGHQTFFKLKLISAHYLNRQPAAVHRCNEFDALFFYLQC